MNKRKQARELALEALAEKMRKQEQVKDATQRAFLAQSEFDDVRERFATALQELDQLGESQTWMRESFGLSVSELRNLLALDVTNEDDEDDEQETNHSPAHDSVDQAGDAAPSTPDESITEHQ